MIYSAEIGRDFPKERSRKELEELGNVSNGREEVVKF